MPPAWYEVIIRPVASAALRGGANSATIASPIGISPPSPSPETKRPAPKKAALGASAHSAEPSEKRTTLPVTIGLRPAQSVRVPQPRAPSSMPKVVQEPMVPAVDVLKPKPSSSRRCGMTAP